MSSYVLSLQITSEYLEIFLGRECLSPSFYVDLSGSQAKKEKITFQKERHKPEHLALLT